jgi:hypothetical protein
MGPKPFDCGENLSSDKEDDEENDSNNEEEDEEESSTPERTTPDLARFDFLEEEVIIIRRFRRKPTDIDVTV